MMSDQEEQQEENRPNTFKENAIFFVGAVVVFNIILVVLWVVYIFRSYGDFSRFHQSQQVAMFDNWMKYAVWWDIALGIVLNVLFMAGIYRWLKNFRSGKENPDRED
ncbi:MAG: hypothetical protein NTY14_03155 [Candidatus Omnitrophica bacterium]|nr:hypothetical protein [Candidatus Omnitrophota bacterium]